MKLVCNRCKVVFERHESARIYGTFCPKCSQSMPPSGKPDFVKDWEDARELLRQEFIEKFKKEIEDEDRRNV